MNILERYIHHFGRWWWSVILITLIAGGASYWIAYVSPGDYRASATLLVNLTQTPGTIVLDDVLVSERLTTTYEELIATRPILDKAAARLGGSETAEELRESIGVSAIADTQLLRITAQGDDPDRAAAIANAVANVFIEENNLQPEGTRPGTVSVIEPADPPEAREGPSLPARTALGTLAGVALALILIIGKTYFDTSVWKPEDLGGLVSRVPFLGVLPQANLNPPTPLGQSLKLPPLTQPYRVLAANVLSAIGRSDGPDPGSRAVVIVSAVRGEGRTSITARLGVAIALEGHRVTLVDFDLRKPSLHQEFNLSSESGIGESLASTTPLSKAQPPEATGWTPKGFKLTRKSRQMHAPGLEESLTPTSSPIDGYQARETALEGLKVLPCGQYSGAPAAQLSAQQVRIALEQVMKDKPDFIFFDTPPLADGAEAVILGQLVDSAIIVVEAKRTPVHLVTSVAAQLDAMGLPILGFVLNKR